MWTPQREKYHGDKSENFLVYVCVCVNLFHAVLVNWQLFKIFWSAIFPERKLFQRFTVNCHSRKREIGIILVPHCWPETCMKFTAILQNSYNTWWSVFSKAHNYCVLLQIVVDFRFLRIPVRSENRNRKRRTWIKIWNHQNPCKFKYFKRKSWAWFSYKYM